MVKEKLNKHYKGVYPALVILLIASVIFSIGFGAVSISLHEMWSSLAKVFSGSNDLSLTERVFIEIRLPRALLCVLTGASLAAGGVLMQGLFRNPIVEPGLIGTSSGAAFGAALYFVLGAVFKLDAGEWTLPVAACAGGVLATFMVFTLSRSRETGKSSTVTLLLTGIAINALFLSGVGLMSYLARDPQARSIAFWNLGTLSGANWHNVIIVFISTACCLLMALRYTKQLNALMIGEEEAGYLGVDTKRLRLTVLLINVVLVAVATAFTGVISFVGLVVPHLLRIIKGSDNRFLLIGSALAGGTLLSLADLASRLLLQPAEMPVGIVTSVVGVPVFIILLRTKSYYF
jgi:iron complex transport system permease protein